MKKISDQDDDPVYQYRTHMPQFTMFWQARSCCASCQTYAENFMKIRSYVFRNVAYTAETKPAVIFCAVIIRFGN